MSLFKFISGLTVLLVLAMLLAACGETATPAATTSAATTSAAATTAAMTSAAATTAAMTSAAATTAATTSAAATTAAMTSASTAAASSTTAAMTSASTAAASSTTAAMTSAGTAMASGTAAGTASGTTAATSGGTAANIPPPIKLTAPHVPGSVVTYREITDVPTADPALTQDSESILAFSNVFDGLTEFGADGQTVTPAIASSWDISADGLVYTFHLRNDVKFSNGDPVKASDFIYSWGRLLKNPNAPYGYVMDSIKGIADAADGNITDTAKLASYVDTNLPQAVQAPDDYTLKITLAQPASFFLAETALWAYWVVDKNVVQKFADPNAKDPTNKDKDLNSLWAEAPNNKGNLVGTGAYTLTAWAHDQKLTFKSNPNYFEGQPALDEFDMVIIKDNASAQQQFEAGKIDILDPIDPNDYDRLKSDAKLKTQLTETPALRVTYLGLNYVSGPFAGDKGKTLRQAISYSIDKNALIASALNGIGYPANSLLVGIPGDEKNSLPCYDSYDPYKFDPAKAKQLLAQAGYSTPDQLSQLGKAIGAYAFNTSDTQKAIGENIQAQLKQNIGLDVSLSNEDFKPFLTDRQNHKFIMYRDSWGADYPDPQDFLQPLAGTGQPENNEGWTNKQYDDLVTKGNSASNINDRCTAYKAANKIYLDDAATVPLFYGKNIDLVSPKANGWKNTPVNPLPFKYVMPSA